MGFLAGEEPEYWDVQSQNNFAYNNLTHLLIYSFSYALPLFQNLISLSTLELSLESCQEDGVLMQVILTDTWGLFFEMCLSSNK